MPGNTHQVAWCVSLFTTSLSCWVVLWFTLFKQAQNGPGCLFLFISRVLCARMAVLSASFPPPSLSLSPHFFFKFLSLHLSLSSSSLFLSLPTHTSSHSSPPLPPLSSPLSPPPPTPPHAFSHGSLCPFSPFSPLTTLSSLPTSLCPLPSLSLSLCAPLSPSRLTHVLLLPPFPITCAVQLRIISKRRWLRRRQRNPTESACRGRNPIFVLSDNDR